MSSAWMSARSGHAIVVTDSEHYLLEAGRQAPPQPCAPGQLNNLRALASDVVMIEADVFPFPEVQKTLNQVWREQSALDLLLMTLDRDLEESLRQEAARVASRLLARPEVYEAVRRTLLGTPLPEVADVEGAPVAQGVTELVHEAAECRELVSIANRALERTIWNYGLGYSDRQDLRDSLIRYGSFAVLVQKLRARNAKSTEAAEIAPQASHLKDLVTDWYKEALGLCDASEYTQAASLSALGKMLKQDALRLEKEPSRRAKFRALLEDFYRRVPDSPGLARDLIMTADHYQLPGWAVECLPSLFYVSTEVEDGFVKALVWHFLAACMGDEGRGWKQERSLCAGHVLEVSINADMLAWLVRVAPEFEKRRVSFPAGSDRAMKGLATDTMVELELAEASQGRVASAKRFRKARQSLLKHIPVAKVPTPDLGRIIDALKKTTASLSTDERREKEFEERIRMAAFGSAKPGLVGELVARIARSESQFPYWATKMARELRAGN